MAITFNSATASSTFADLFTDSDTNTTWYQLWTGNAAGNSGSWVDTSAFTNEGDGWIAASDLANLEADFAQSDDTDLWIRTWNATDGTGAWSNGAVDFNAITGAASTDPTVGIDGVPVTTVVTGDTAMNDMFNVENVDSNTWLRIWVGDADGTGGSYLGTDYGDGWVLASEYATELFPAAAPGESKELWVATWDGDTGMSGWTHWDVATQGDINLDLDNDVLTGTVLDDLFLAPVVQNPFGGTANTLGSGDNLDGGDGIDTLDATLVPEFIGMDHIGFIGLDGILSPITNDLEILTFRVQQITTGVIDSEGLAGIDAGQMMGVDEIWSSDSRADLVVEDVRAVPEDTIIGMQDTAGSSVGGVGQPGVSDLSIRWDAEWLLGDVEAESVITMTPPLANLSVIGVMLAFDADGDGVITGDPGNLVDDTDEYFHINWISADPTAPDEATNAAELAAELQEYLASAQVPAALANLTVEIDGASVDLIDDQGRLWDAVQSEWNYPGGYVPGTGDAQWRMVSDDEEEDIPITTNVVLDNVGRTTAGGDLDIGSLGTRGVERFLVDVGANSNVASLYSMNRSVSDGIPMNERLQIVNIEDLDAPGDADYGSALQIGNLNSDLGQPVGSATNLFTGLWNVRQVDASDDFNDANYTGDLNITVQLDNTADLNGVGNFMAEQLYNDESIYKAQQDLADDPDIDTLLEALYLNRVQYNYYLGSGNDTLVIDIDDPVDSMLEDYGMGTNDAITELNIKAGAGNDHVLFDAVHADPAGLLDYMNYDPNSTSVSIVDGGDGVDTFELSHSLGTFGDDRGDGRAFDGIDWFEDDDAKAFADNADGFMNFENLIVSDRLDDAGAGASNGADVYVDLDTMAWTGGKIGGEGYYYEVTNADITFLDNSNVFAGAAGNQATNLFLTGGDVTGEGTFAGPGNVDLNDGVNDGLEILPDTAHITANVGDVIVTMENEVLVDIDQPVFLNNTGKSGDVFTVNSLTVSDPNLAGLSSVTIYSQGTSQSGSNTLRSFLSTDIATLFIAGDGDTLADFDQDYEDEDLTITLANAGVLDNVDVVDASGFNANLTIDSLDGDDETISGGSGNDRIEAGAGNDILNGNAGDDQLVGGLGGDTMNGGAGVDVFIYDQVADSVLAQDATLPVPLATVNDVLTGMDVLTNLDFDEDLINIRGLPTVNADDTYQVSTATIPLTEGNLVNELEAQFNGLAGLLGADNVINAMIITDDNTDDGADLDATGDLRARQFLVIDSNDNGDLDLDNSLGFGQDLVIEVTGFTGTFGADDFGTADMSDPVIANNAITTNNLAQGLTFDINEPGWLSMVNDPTGAAPVLYPIPGPGQLWNAPASAVAGNAYEGYLQFTDMAGNTTVDWTYMYNVLTDAADVDPITGGTWVFGDINNNILPGAGADLISGGAGDDLIANHGDGARDWLQGGAGNDTIMFNTEAVVNYDDLDILDGGTGTDTLLLADDTGNGGVIDLLNGLWVNVDAAQLLNFNNVDVSPDANNWFLQGDNAANVLTGGAGSDTLFGQAGSDVLEGNAGSDLLVGGAGADSLDGGAGTDSLAGGTGNDTLDGGAGADSDGLWGGPGLDGGQGADTLTGGLLAADDFEFGDFDAVDTVTDFETGVDALLFNDTAGSVILGTAMTGGGSYVGVTSNPTFLTTAATSTGVGNTFTWNAGGAGLVATQLWGSNMATNNAAVMSFLAQLTSTVLTPLLTAAGVGGTAMFALNGAGTAIQVNLTATTGAATAMLGTFSVNALVQTAGGLKLINIINATSDTITSATGTSVLTFAVANGTIGTETGAINTLALVADNFAPGDIILL